MKTLFKNTLAGLAASALLAPAAALVSPSAAVPSALATGPEIFQAQGCTKCHSVTAAGIPRAPDKDDDAKDLSTVGSRHDKKAIATYLLKKSEIDGAKHKPSFGGTTLELKMLVEWLETLK